MANKADALVSLAPDAEWVLSGDTIRWDSPDIDQPSDAEIDAEIVRLDAEYASQQYARNRAAAYPSIGDQLDMIYWDSVNNTTTWKDAIAAVKAAHPKP
jgi:hypothetical protein|tara:strand:- start:23 stop:319 length:297 start_codon:yes stop_codon:yes gene_type:complete